MGGYDKQSISILQVLQSKCVCQAKLVKKHTSHCDFTFNRYKDGINKLSLQRLQLSLWISQQAAALPTRVIPLRFNKADSSFRVY